MVTAPASDARASFWVASMSSAVAWVMRAPSVTVARVSASMLLMDTSPDTAMPNLPLPAWLDPPALPAPSWVSCEDPASGASVCDLLLVAMAPTTE